MLGDLLVQGGTMTSQMSPTIFVVEDDDLSRNRLCQLLRSFGWDAAGFTTTQMSRSSLPALMADCMLLDLTANESNGLQVLTSLRQRALHTRVIALALNGDSDHLMRGPDSAVKAVLHKPIDPTVMRSTILSVIGQPSSLAVGA